MNSIMRPDTQTNHTIPNNFLGHGLDLICCINHGSAQFVRRKVTLTNGPISHFLIVVM